MPTAVRPNTRTSARAQQPRRATARWLAMLCDMLCNQPAIIRDRGSTIITDLQPAHVSDSPDERLFVLATFAAASTVMCHPPGTPYPCTEHLYSHLMNEYREWDPQGVPLVTSEGRDRAWEQINDTVHN